MQIGLKNTLRALPIIFQSIFRKRRAIQKVIPMMPKNDFWDISVKVNEILLVIPIILKYRKTPHLVPRINYANNFFSKLFNRGLKCINKVLKKSFWSRKFTFKTRING